MGGRRIVPHPSLPSSCLPLRVNPFLSFRFILSFIQSLSISQSQYITIQLYQNQQIKYRWRKIIVLIELYPTKSLYLCIAMKKKITRNISEQTRQMRRERMKLPPFDQYKGLDSARYSFALSLGEAYYIDKEMKRRKCSKSEVIRSCIDYIINNNIIIN